MARRAGDKGPKFPKAEVGKHGQMPVARLHVSVIGSIQYRASGIQHPIRGQLKKLNELKKILKLQTLVK
jgi:hypothetical protein